MAIDTRPNSEQSPDAAAQLDNGEMQYSRNGYEYYCNEVHHFVRIIQSLVSGVSLSTIMVSFVPRLGISSLFEKKKCRKSVSYCYGLLTFCCHMIECERVVVNYKDCIFNTLLILRIVLL